MKKNFIIFAFILIVGSINAQGVKISPNVCGAIVGKTSKTGKTIAEWDGLFKDQRPMKTIALAKDQEVLLGNFIVEGLHFSLLSMELMNDTIYQISLYEKSPYADCWDQYKDKAFKIRDKYAHLKDVTAPSTHNKDSIVTFYKTDGTTILLFYADPHGISYIVTSEHFNNIYVQNLTKEINTLITGKTGPNYDEKNRVTSIAGVRFGESRQNTINAFKQRGTLIDNKSAREILFSNVNFGGTTFRSAILYFQYDSRKFDMALSAARFEKNFYEWRREEALMTYEAVASKYKEKYSNCLIIKDEEDDKIMVCGMIEDSYAEGKIPPIVVSFNLGVSRGGEKFYYVTVSYFNERMSSIAHDDI